MKKIKGKQIIKYNNKIIILLIFSLLIYKMKTYKTFNEMNKIKQNPREFIASKPALQEILNRDLRTEMKGYHLVTRINRKKCRAFLV